MNALLFPKIASAAGGNVRITTANAALTGLALEVNPLGVTGSGTQAPIKMNGSASFNLTSGAWVFTVHFQNVKAQANFDVSVVTAQANPMLPPGPLNGNTAQHNVGRLSFVVQA